MRNLNTPTQPHSGWHGTNSVVRCWCRRGINYGKFGLFSLFYIYFASGSTMSFFLSSRIHTSRRISHSPFTCGREWIDGVSVWTPRWLFHDGILWRNFFMVHASRILVWWSTNQVPQHIRYGSVRCPSFWWDPRVHIISCKYNKDRLGVGTGAFTE